MDKDKLKKDKERERANPLAMFFVKDGKVGKKTESGAIPQDGNYINIDLDKIRPNRFQPRTNFDDTALNELAESIKARGVIQPVIVRKLHRDTVSQDGIEYELIAGERRLRASKIAGLTIIPAVIKETSDDELRTLALIENIQREDLSVMDKAKAILQLKNDNGLKKEDIAKVIGLSVRMVERNIKIAEADEVYQNMIIDNKLSFRVSDKLMSLGEKIDRLKNKDQALYNKLIKTLQKNPVTEELLDKIVGNYFSKESKTDGNEMRSAEQIKRENFYETETELGLNFKVNKADIQNDEHRDLLIKQTEKFFNSLGAKEVMIRF
ncbi:MAG: ParB/RepB/Spo0J family partition protein [Nitrospirae bacterium]|nr:ParB/RepB/Spo0J family partition protein [Nitrospirota bacterium]